MDVFRGATGVVAGAGPVNEVVGAVIVPRDRERFKVSDITFESDLAGAADAVVRIQQSINNGVAWTTEFQARLSVVGSMELASDRSFFVGQVFQPDGGSAAGAVNQLQYRLSVLAGLAADVYSASLQGRTSRGSEVYRQSDAIAAVGVVAEVVDPLAGPNGDGSIVPNAGETLRVNDIIIATDLAGALPTDVELQQSVNSGGAWAGIWRGQIPAAGTIHFGAETRGMLAQGNAYQPRGATVALGNQVQYRLVVIPGTIGDVYSAAVCGRSARG